MNVYNLCRHLVTTCSRLLPAEFIRHDFRYYIQVSFGNVYSNDVISCVRSCWVLPSHVWLQSQSRGWAGSEKRRCCGAAEQGLNSFPCFISCHVFKNIHFYFLSRFRCHWIDSHVFPNAAGCTVQPVEPDQPVVFLSRKPRPPAGIKTTLGYLHALLS